MTYIHTEYLPISFLSFVRYNVVVACVDIYVVLIHEDELCYTNTTCTKCKKKNKKRNTFFVMQTSENAAR